MYNKKQTKRIAKTEKFTVDVVYSEKIPAEICEKMVDFMASGVFENININLLAFRQAMGQPEAKGVMTIGNVLSFDKETMKATVEVFERNIEKVKELKDKVIFVSVTYNRDGNFKINRLILESKQ